MKLLIYKTKNNIDLLISEPFQHFENDCETCKNFYTIPIIHPSGKCTKHEFCCGYGFTCKDYERSE